MYGEPFVSQLGQGCTLTTYFLLEPTYYNTSDESSPINSYKNIKSCAVAQKSQSDTYILLSYKATS